MSSRDPSRQLSVASTTSTHRLAGWSGKENVDESLSMRSEGCEHVKDGDDSRRRGAMTVVSMSASRGHSASHAMTQSEQGRTLVAAVSFY